MFEGKFYNGSSTKGIPATIVLEPNHIRINWNIDGRSGSELWHLSEVKKVVSAEGTTELTYSGKPAQRIAVFEQGFRDALQQKYSGAAFLKPNYSPSLKMGCATIVGIGLLVLGLLAAAFVWGIPALAGKVAMHFPEEYEQALGRQLHEQMMQGQTIDQAKTTALQAYVQALEIESDFPIHVTVVKDEQVNAFAVPGGFIVVHDALLAKMERHEELAGLLGHEAGHVQLRHSTKAIVRGLSYYMLLSLLFGDLTGVAAVIVDNTSMLTHLEYSRSAETEADEAGLALLQQNNLNPNGMLWLMQRLKSSDAEIASFLSTHPSTTERMQELRTQIKNTNYKPNPNPNPELEAAWAKLKGE